MKYIQHIPIYDRQNCANSNIMIQTTISIHDIEKTIYKIFDKYDHLCKYYIDIDKQEWNVSFRVDIEQIDAMMQTSFSFKIFQDQYNIAIIDITKEIKNHPQWQEVYSYMLKKLTQK